MHEDDSEFGTEMLHSSPCRDLFYLLPEESWPDSPHIPPFAIVTATTVTSPVALKSFEKYRVESCVRRKIMPVPPALMEAGGWHAMRYTSAEALDCTKYVDQDQKEYVPAVKLIEMGVTPPSDPKGEWDIHTIGLTRYNNHKELQIFAPAHCVQAAGYYLLGQAEEVIYRGKVFKSGDVWNTAGVWHGFIEVPGEAPGDPTRLRVVEVAEPKDECR